ncbi:hypothetical protein [Streptomyces sp. PpalLS-921]|nr:hypothetical protein [Streptomyces sp. PpalLS-921]SCE29340.1 hypothetical protein GA0115249_117181 [Streptomyces sp. PpalLS-921]
MSTLPQHWRGIRVPFVAPWSGERHLPGRIIRHIGSGGVGIAYADECSQTDRRPRCPLAAALRGARGAGTPFLAGIHPLRQRQAMSHLLCQVCGKSTFDDDYARWGERHLVVARAVEEHPLREGERTNTPPVCLPCALESVEACPHLRGGKATAALVREMRPWGAAGIVYHPETIEPIRDGMDATEDGLTLVGIEDPWIR